MAQPDHPENGETSGVVLRPAQDLLMSLRPGTLADMMQTDAANVSVHLVHLLALLFSIIKKHFLGSWCSFSSSSTQAHVEWI